MSTHSKLTPRQLHVMWLRENFFDETDGFYKECLKDYESLLAFRKTIKQKPTELERLLLDMNNIFIESYQTLLFHVPPSVYNNCTCRTCDIKRKSLSKK